MLERSKLWYFPFAVVAVGGIGCFSRSVCIPGREFAVLFLTLKECQRTLKISFLKVLSIGIVGRSCHASEQLSIEYDIAW